MSKSILFVLDYFTPHRWGAETVFATITKKLVQRGYKVYIVTSRYDCNLPREEQIHGMYIMRAGRGRKSFLFSGIWAGIKVLRRYSDISLIHTSTYWGALPGFILSLLFRKKVLLTVHEVFGSLWYVYKNKLRAWLYILFERLIFCCSWDWYHSVSCYTMNSVRLIYWVQDSRHSMIYNGIDTNFWNIDKVGMKDIDTMRSTFGIAADDFILTYYGHSGKSKWLCYLIDALPHLLERYPHLHVVCNLIYARADEQMKKTLYSLNHQDRVHILSWLALEKLRSLVAMSNVVVAPSLSEGFGSVHAEVSAMGIPLITTHVAAIPEVVYGKVVFVQAQDSLSIVDAVKKVIDGNVSCIPHKEFSRDDTVDQLEKIYHQLDSLC
jgi:glycosyltransferase involved in cell wall biosynthesis